MNAVRRSSMIRRTVRRVILRKPERKYVISGDRACREMMQNARRRRRRRDVEAESILAWARFDLTREIIGGFWTRPASYPACPVL